MVLLMGLGVDISGDEEELDDVGVAVTGGHHESCETVAGDFVGIGAAVEQSLHRFDLRCVDRMEKGSPVIAAGRLVGISTLVDEIADRGDIAGAGGVSERSEFRIGPGASEEKSSDEGESHLASNLSSTFRRKV